MIIRFGMDFDTLVPDPPKSRLGRINAGPLSLLSILETQLGIYTPFVSSAKRLIQYRACLSMLDNRDRFYHRSFEVDDLGVAKTLLDWRDQWLAAAWDGKILETAGKRLRDMADVEKIACQSVAPSTGERLQAVLKELKGRKTQIKKIEIVDALEDMPYLWQQVLFNFDIAPLAIDKRKPSTSVKTDLNKFRAPDLA